MTYINAGKLPVGNFTTRIQLFITTAKNHTTEISPKTQSTTAKCLKDHPRTEADLE